MVQQSQSDGDSVHQNVLDIHQGLRLLGLAQVGALPRADRKVLCQSRGIHTGKFSGARQKFSEHCRARY